ncbi:hypothetical protein QR680_000477 [Steinernema hermaphroditum]|uniref:Golgin subfamily A conserved domain-containing protein n=1 Tax=Steinernema hermaphroditum TaxID=289476 RepID=A0AA39LE62_9BILA|nr:hypothetical protein QR680_000477 [Steinernema hermaphroditum]
MADHAGKVANARKKLKEFQAKRVGGHGEQAPARSAPSPSLSVSSTSELQNGRMSVSSVSHEDTPNSYSQRQTPDLRINDAHHYQPSYDGSSDVSESQQTVEKLRVALHRSGAELRSLNEKHQELVGHYSNLHSAYEQLVANPPVSKTVESQITKLQAALSAVVEEKTSLQGVIRTKDHRINELSEEVMATKAALENAIAHSHDHATHSEPVSITQEAKIRRFETEIQTLSDTVSRQQEELSRRHKEAASMEIKVQRMQQDQNDAQARLRTAYRENEEKSAMVRELQKKCELLEIHVGQMRKHGLDQDGNVGLIDENTQLKEQISDLILENDDLKKQADSARIYYESYKADLDVRIAELTKEFNGTREALVKRTDELHNAQDQIRDLTNELSSLRAKQAQSRDGSNSSPNCEEEVQSLRVYAEELHDKYTRVCEKQQESIVELTEIKKAYDSLKSVYETSEHQLEEERGNVRRLKEASENTQMVNTDVRGLMEQLVNEKATVSRAVSQNSELKEQLIALEDKLISVMNESAEREQQLQSALFTIEQMRESSAPKAENYPPPAIVHDDSSEEDCSSCGSANDHPHDCDQGAVSHEHTHTERHSESSNAPIPEHEVIYLRERLNNVTDELEATRMELRRITAENSEFHRIMEQNAEDENQNNIHVELGHAMNRISDLNAENEQLRLELSNSTNGNAHNNEISSAEDSPTPATYTPGKSSSSTNSVAQQTDGRPAVGSAQWTKEELEGRLVRALRQNAEVVDKNERLEHMLIALETENDTIGEYVTLYQHQRTKIRARLAERDEQIAQLTQEKMRVQTKLNELQSQVFSLLTKRGLLQSYQTGQTIHGSKAAAEAAKNRRVTKRAGKIRTFSQSISDELSGEEEVIIDSEELYLPPLPDQEVVVDVEALEGQEATTSNGVPGPPSPNGNTTAADEGDVRVTKILQLLTDLQTPEKPSEPFDANIHCKDCRGNLITI